MECVKCKKSIPADALFCQYCGKKQQSLPKKTKKRTNGTGSIIKKAGKRSKPWEVQKAGVYIGCYETKHEAERALATLIDANVSQKFSMTFREIYERWKPTHSKRVGASGLSGYQTAYGHCSPLYNRTFRSLRKADFQAVINQMEEDGLSKSSCEKVLHLFGQLSTWAIEEEDICHKNYARGVVISAQQKKTEHFVFSDEQILAIRDASAVASDIALILISSGCRPVDLFTAETANCFDTYFISGSKTAAGRNRVIPINQIGLAAYYRILGKARSRNAPHLIDGYDGNRTYKNFQRRDWKELMFEIGLSNVVPYDCRHTYATLAVKSNVQPEVLQKILGHASYTTTIKHYTHLDKDFVLAGSKRIAITDTLQTQENAVCKSSTKSSENK